MCEIRNQFGLPALAQVEPLIDASEAAKILNCSVENVRRKVRMHILPHVRLGKRVLFRASTLCAWMTEQEIQSVRPFAAKEGA